MIVKLPPVEAAMPTTTLVAFTVRESATEPVAMVSVVEGEVRVTGVAEVKSSGAAWAGETRRPAATASEVSTAQIGILGGKLQEPSMFPYFAATVQFVPSQ